MIYRIIPASMAVDRPVLPLPGSKAGEFERIGDALQWVAAWRSNCAILTMEESAGPVAATAADPEDAARSVS